MLVTAKEKAGVAAVVEVDELEVVVFALVVTGAIDVPGSVASIVVGLGKERR